MRSCSYSCSLFSPKPSVVCRPSVHPSRPRDKQCLPPSLPSYGLPPPHAKLPQHSHIFPWRQRGGRPTQAERYHCNVIPPLGLIVHRQRGTSTNRQYSLSVYPSSPSSTYLPVWQSDRPDAIHDIQSIGNTQRLSARVVCLSVQFLSDRQTAFQELAGPNLDL